MELVSVNAAGKVRRETLNGRPYLVAPLSMIVPGVLPGSKGRLYYPPSEVQATSDAWNGIPIVVGHPKLNGRHVSARSPRIVERFGIGHVYEAAFNGKLTGEGWFDEELTKNRAPVTYAKLNAGRAGELSTGLFTDDELAENGSKDVRTGRPYDYVARNYRPDHLAVLEDEIGACSVDDGCGIGVNAGVGVNAAGSAADPLAKDTKQLHGLTGETDGHQHKLHLDTDGNGWAEFTSGHMHNVRDFEVYPESDQIEGADGHVHEIEQDQLIATHPTDNQFCATGEGGGIDNSCASGGDGNGGSARVGGEDRAGREAVTEKVRASGVASSGAHSASTQAFLISRDSDSFEAADKARKLANRANSPMITAKGRKDVTGGRSKHHAAASKAHAAAAEAHEAVAGRTSGAASDAHRSAAQAHRTASTKHRVSASADRVIGNAEDADDAETTDNNCGVGEGGFEEGNTCAGGGGSGREEPRPTGVKPEIKEKYPHLAHMLNGIRSVSTAGTRREASEKAKASGARVMKDPKGGKGAKFLVLHSGTYGNPQSTVSGKFKSHGADVGKGSAHVSAQRGRMTLTAEDRSRGADAQAQLTEFGMNPPGWAVDEPTWERAKGRADEGGYDGDEYWAVVSHIYKKMGGTMGADQTDADESTTDNQTPAGGTLEGDDMPTPTKEQHAANVKFLTANCDCWKGQDKVLNGMQPEHVAKIVAANKVAKSNELAVNAVRRKFDVPDDVPTTNMPAFMDEKYPEEEEAAAPVAPMKKKAPMVEEEEEEVPAGNTRKPKTMKDWLAEMPSEAVPVWNAQQRQLKARTEFVANELKKIAANANPKLKARITARLADNKGVDYLERLEEVYDFVAPTTENRRRTRGDDPLPPANYAGAGGFGFGWGDPTANEYADDAGEDEATGNAADDILEIPVVNFSREKSQQQSA